MHLYTTSHTRAHDYTGHPIVWAGTVIQQLPCQGRKVGLQRSPQSLNGILLPDDFGEGIPEGLRERHTSRVVGRVWEHQRDI